MQCASLGLTGARFMVTFLFQRIIPFAGDRGRDNARPPSETNVLRFIVNTVTYSYTAPNIFRPLKSCQPFVQWRHLRGTKWPFGPV